MLRLQTTQPQRARSYTEPRLQHGVDVFYLQRSRTAPGSLAPLPLPANHLRLSCWSERSEDANMQKEQAAATRTNEKLAGVHAHLMPRNIGELIQMFSKTTRQNYVRLIICNIDRA